MLRSVPQFSFVEQQGDCSHSTFKNLLFSFQASNRINAFLCQSHMSDRPLKPETSLSPPLQFFFLHFGVYVIQSSGGRGHLSISTLCLCLMLMGRIIQLGSNLDDKPSMRTGRRGKAVLLSAYFSRLSQQMFQYSGWMCIKMGSLIWIFTYILLN